MTVLTYDSPLDTPLSGGATSVAPNVPDQFEIAINGRAYRVDHNAPQGVAFSRRSVNVQRAQADTSATPGEQTLNREADWRRVVESWHHGAGQTYFDREDSDKYRFSASKGVNVWDKWSLSLLNDTSKIRTSGNTNLRLTTAGSYTYLIDGNNLLYTSDVTAGTVTWTTVTGTPGVAAQWVTSDGYNVYVAYGASGIYTTTRGAAAATSLTALATSVLGYVKGRLMAANGNALYNVTAAGPPPAALLTHPNTDFAWVGFAEGPGYIYAAGFSGNRSLVYKTAILADGTALAIPVVAGELPTGEIVRSIKGYLGVLLIGTDLGVRMAMVNSDGSLSIGSLVATTSPVLNFEPGDRFVWYGLTNYDSNSTGLGRMDLTIFTTGSALTPAYASDLMAASQGAVLSISTQGTKRVFAVSGVGVYVESNSKVESGSLTSGRITYGIGDEKVAMSMDLRTAALTGTVAVGLAVDAAAPASIGGSTVPGSTRPAFPLTANQARGEFFETTLTLTRSVSSPTLGPTVNRYTLRAYPAPRRTFQFTVPLILWSVQFDENDSEYTLDPLVERQFLEGLMNSSQLVTYQEGNASYTVLVEDTVWLPRKQTGDRNTYDGTLVAVLKEMAA